MAGVLKLMASIAIIAVAAVATLLVFDVIPAGVFSEVVRKVLLAGIIVALASAAIAFIMRLGR